MIEANHLHKGALSTLTRGKNDEYLIAALGDEEREVTFYTRSDKPHTEGNSYYEEVNYWDIQHLVQKNKITLQRLDDLFTDDTTPTGKITVLPFDYGDSVKKEGGGGSGGAESPAFKVSKL